MGTMLAEAAPEKKPQTENSNPKMNPVNIEKSNYELCFINTQTHIDTSLGEPVLLPPSIQERLEECDFAEDANEDLILLFSLMKGCKYEQVVRTNTSNYETDFSDFFIYTVYAPAGSSDWLWQRDCFVTVEIGSTGDPRYVGYSVAQVYDLGDNLLAETGLLSNRMSWYARYLPHKEIDENSDEASFLEKTNEELESFYSSNPTYRLGELCYADPLWVEKYQGFVARPEGSRFPMIFDPQPPYYG